MKSFKFLSKNKTPIDWDYVFVDYTTEHNGKSFTGLKFVSREEDTYPNNTNHVRIFNGTFMQFKNMVHNDPDLDWFHNRPLIHKIKYYSINWWNCQREAKLSFFRRGRHRFKKNQQLKIFYEIV